MGKQKNGRIPSKEKCKSYVVSNMQTRFPFPEKCTKDIVTF